MTQKNFIFLFLLMLGVSTQFAAAQKSRVKGHVKAAQNFMDEGRYGEAVKSYKKAIKVDDNNDALVYGLAMAYYRQEAYKETIKYAEQLVKKEKTEVNYFRLLGNSYDLLNNYKRAIQTLKTGLEKHPKSGKLYLDLGLIEMFREHTEDALKYWEEGIKTEPTVPDNYYWAARTFANSNQKVWTLIYGEIFMNMERGTTRFDTMSNILYATYLELLENNGVFKKGKITIEKKHPNTFEDAHKRIWSLLNKIGVVNLDRGRTINDGVNHIKAIALFRKDFLETWLQGFILTYPNTLYKHHRDMFDLTFYEAYHFWLFSKARTDDFVGWMQKNQPKYQVFIDWFLDHPLKVDVVDYVVRTQYIDTGKK